MHLAGDILFTSFTERRYTRWQTAENAAIHKCSESTSFMEVCQVRISVIVCLECSDCIAICVSVCLCVVTVIAARVSLCVCLSVCLSVCVSVCLSVYV